MTVDIETYRSQFDEARKDVTRLYVLRHVGRNINAILVQRTDMPQSSLVRNYLATTYAESLAVGIRRQAQFTGERATIGNLLQRVQVNAQQFTRASCGFDIDQLPGREDPWLQFADNLDDHLDPARTVRVSDQLAEAKSSTTTWVNRKIAHLDPRGLPEPTSFADLERGLGGLRQGLMYLYSLFYPGNILWQITPIVSRDMFEMLSRPWFLDGMPVLDESDFDPSAPGSDEPNWRPEDD